MNFVRVCSTIFFMFLSLFTPIKSSLAGTYQVGDFKLELPFPEKWRVQNKDTEGQLVFFDATRSNPRPIITVTLSPFQYPPDNVSEFEKIMREKKEEWLTKHKGRFVDSLTIEFLEEEKSVLSRMSFKVEQGHFHEWTRFQQCSAKRGVILKWMIPDSFIQVEEQVINEWKELLVKSLCKYDESIE